jgi:cell division protease FtsH
MLLILGAMLFGMWMWRSSIEGARAPSIDYSSFYAMAQEGKVESVVIRGQVVEGKFKGQEQVQGQKLEHFETLTPRDDQQLLPLLREKGVKLRVASEEQPVAIGLLLNLLPFLLMIGAWVWLSRRAQRSMFGGGPLGGFMKSRSKKFEKTAQVNITFADVAGLKSAKRDLEEIVGFLREPDRFRRLGGKVPRGVLLIGPPGTGKTLLARAVAGESGVPFYSIAASEFIEMFVGVGAARVRELFEDAKKSAPAIIFIDEIDAVGRSRGAGLGGGHDEREQTLNQLLSEMDGFTRSDLTIVIAATNRPDVLDPALLRPGRFDRRVVVGRPEFEARRAILAVHTKDKPLAESVDLATIARNTPGFSGADLANLANEAALSATRRGADAIEADDFLSAQDKIVLGDPSESKLDAKEKRRVAVHESGHAIVAHFSEHAEPLHRVTIIPRGMALGVTQQTPAEDRHIMTQPELESRLKVLMGGYAAERMILGDVSTGAENDLKEATKIATKMVANYGMSKRLGAVYYEHESEHPFLGQRIGTESGTSDATVHTIESEARTVLTGALEGSESLLKRRRAELDKLASALLDQETIERKGLVELLGESVEKEERSVPKTPVHAVGT